MWPETSECAGPERDINTSGSEVIQVIGRSNFDLDLWMSVQQLWQYGQETGADETRRCADTHTPASAAVRCFREQETEPFDTVQHLAGFVEQPLALVREGHGMRGAVKEPDAVSASEAADCPGDAGGGHDLTGWLWTGLIERISQDRRSWTCGEVRRRVRSRWC